MSNNNSNVASPNASRIGTGTADSHGDDERLLKRDAQFSTGKVGETDDKNKVTLNPMTQLAASSTVVNLLLATGPFS